MIRIHIWALVALLLLTDLSLDAIAAGVIHIVRGFRRRGILCIAAGIAALAGAAIIICTAATAA